MSSNSKHTTLRRHLIFMTCVALFLLLPGRGHASLLSIQSSESWKKLNKKENLLTALHKEGKISDSGAELTQNLYDSIKIIKSQRACLRDRVLITQTHLKRINATGEWLLFYFIYNGLDWVIEKLDLEIRAIYNGNIWFKNKLHSWPIGDEIAVAPGNEVMSSTILPDTWAEISNVPEEILDNPDQISVRIDILDALDMNGISAIMDYSTIERAPLLLREFPLNGAAHEAWKSTGATRNACATWTAPPS